MFDHVSSFKEQAKIFNKKFVDYNFILIAHNGSGFDSYVVLNNLPRLRSVVTLIRNGAGIF